MTGKIIGWLFLGFALISASAEGVMALGTSSESGLATGELLALLAGHTAPAPNTALDRIFADLLALPAWAVSGPLGILLILIARGKREPVAQGTRRLMRRRH
ncbi:hypothetical protein HEQ60_07145 [Haematospirillum sp. H1815]|uniref:hypothetical protein n=1 Tax=Haematospirillum sp. H1815 TaxID=2723108 RepID=UPI0014396B19|nr:hypothetical protein [Haematospirillum sp. H1815]NKD77534.1 hypothetical protein [Haematospirillum sp. H1815]